MNTIVRFSHRVPPSFLMVHAVTRDFGVLFDLSKGLRRRDGAAAAEVKYEAEKLREQGGFAAIRFLIHADSRLPPGWETEPCLFASFLELDSLQVRRV